MTEKTAAFDVADYLDSEEMIQEYFRQVAADGDSSEIIEALGEIARARGMMKLAEETGLSRESLYRTLRPGSKPRFDTIFRITKALGLPMFAS